MEQNGKQQRSNSFKIGVTCGDYNSISYEVVVKALSHEMVCDFFTPVFYGSSNLLNNVAETLHVDMPAFSVMKNTFVNHHKINVVNLTSDNASIEPGKCTEQSKQAALLSTDEAIAAVKAHVTDAMVFLPFAGHAGREATGFLAEKLASDHAMRIYCNENLRITSLADCNINKPTEAGANTPNLNVIISRLNYVLKNDFLLSNPKIAVLNYHKHDGNDRTSQYSDVDLAAIAAKSISDGIAVFGPYNSDFLFIEQYKTQFDAFFIVNDVPAGDVFGMLTVDGGVVYTSGLPFTVTEPYYDNMYEAAGKSTASALPLLRAMYLAKDITSNRLENYRLKKNALTFIKLKEAKDENNE